MRPNRLSSPETNSGAPSGRPVASARRSSAKSSSVSTLSSSFRCGILSSAGRTLTSPSSAPYVNFRLPRLSGQQFQIDFVIAVLKKDRLAPVATLGNMMRKPRNHNSSQASHAGTIAPRAGNRYHVPLFPSEPCLRENLPKGDHEDWENEDCHQSCNDADDCCCVHSSSGSGNSLQRWLIGLENQRAYRVTQLSLSPFGPARRNVSPVGSLGSRE